MNLLPRRDGAGMPRYSRCTLLHPPGPWPSDVEVHVHSAWWRRGTVQVSLVAPDVGVGWDVGDDWAAVMRWPSLGVGWDEAVARLDRLAVDPASPIVALAVARP